MDNNKFILITELDDGGDTWTHVAYYRKDELEMAKERRKDLLPANHVKSCILYEVIEIKK